MIGRQELDLVFRHTDGMKIGQTLDFSMSKDRLTADMEVKIVI